MKLRKLIRETVWKNRSRLTHTRHESTRGGATVVVTFLLWTQAQCRFFAFTRVLFFFFFVIRGDGNKSQLLLRRACIHQPWVLLDEKTLLTPLTFCRGVTSSFRRPGRACRSGKYLDELQHSRDEYSRI